MPTIDPTIHNSDEIPVIYEDEHLIAVNKPANLLTVPGRGPDKQDCLINRLLTHYPNSRIVHRLDMATSGIVLIAQSHQAQSLLSQLFANRQIHKTYCAIVDGCLELNEGLIDAPLICDWENRPKQKVDPIGGKAAQTRYQQLSYCSDTNTSRLALFPITGRSHQLRVHLLSIGHPILGDYFYAPEEILTKSPRLLLHAQKLSFIHPFTQKELNLTSPPPF